MKQKCEDGKKMRGLFLGLFGACREFIHANASPLQPFLIFNLPTYSDRMITRLHMKRWKSHEDTELRFGKGSNLFIGKMGSGKSSAIDAVCFALYGTFPALKSRKVKLEELVMQRPKKHATAEIELEFGHEGKNYKIIRHLGSKTTSAQLFEDGKLLEAQTSRVSENVENLLKVDYDLFSRIIYAEQNRIDYLLTLQKGERKRQVDELLGISKFELVRQNAGAAVNLLRASNRDMERFLEGLGILGLRGDLARLEGERAKLNEEMRHKQHTLAEVRENLRALNKKQGALEAQEAQYVKLGKEMAASQALLEDKQRELGKMHEPAGGEDLENLKREVKKFELELKEKNRLMQDATVTLSKTLGKKEVLVEEKRKCEKMEVERKAKTEELKGKPSFREYTAKITETETKMQGIRDVLSASVAEMSESAKAASALDAAGAKCPICDSDLGASKKEHLGHLRRARISELESKISGLRKNAEECGKEIEILRSAQRKAESLNLDIEKLGDPGAEIAKLENEIVAAAGTEKAMKEKMGSFSKEIEEVQKALEEKNLRLSGAEKVLELRKDIDSITEKLGQLTEHYGKTSYKPEEIQKIRGEILKHGREEASLDAQIKAHSGNLAEITSRISDTGSKLKEIDAKELEMKAVKERIATLEGFQEAVTETQALMRGQLIEAMNEAMNSLWASIYPYGDYSKIRLNATDDDYEFELEAAGNGWIGIENCSGGEKSCAALTLRVAFAMVLTPNLSWLILDEPTHNLDSQAVQLLNRALHDEIPKIVEQTFIITHDDALKEGASAKIFYFERDKDAGDRSIVEEMGTE
ncbi:MAG: SMC family ATPase [Candidatus Micrarchaeota archaeon]